MNYVYENGQRYHSYHEGQYYLPNDEIDKIAWIWSTTHWMLIGGDLYRAPIPKARPPPSS
jgi:hypothetical protein